MVAYWIARAKVHDPARYKIYADRVPDVLLPYGARILARGGRSCVMEGPEHFERYVVIEFPDLESAVAAYNSTAYQEARRHRLGGAGEAEIAIVDGAPGGMKN